MRFRDVKRLRRSRDPLVRRYAAEVIARPRDVNAYRSLAFAIRYAALPDWASDVPSHTQSSLGDRMAARTPRPAQVQRVAPPAPPVAPKPAGAATTAAKPFGPHLSRIASFAGPEAARRIDETHRVLHKELGIPVEWRTFQTGLPLAQELAQRHGTQIPDSHAKVLARPGYRNGGYINEETGHLPQTLAGVPRKTQVTAPHFGPDKQHVGSYVVDSLGGIRVGGFADESGRFSGEGVAYIPPNRAHEFKPKLDALAARRAKGP